MSPEHIALVKSSFTRLQPRMNEFVNMFYVRLFDTRPELCLLFGGNIDQQSRVLAAMLDKIVKMLDAPDALVPLLRDLKSRHAAFKVKPEHYAPFGEALLWTLEMMLAREFTAELRQAWREAYDFLATNMR